ncbi:MAG: hypothetical protein KGS09_13200 [Nitrospirae bacterium]|nr:hypothetical protein [Nitrospirota bacterium]MDE3042620.1 hypothetical protein [Nitrospirota bacterium]
MSAPEIVTTIDGSVLQISDQSGTKRVDNISPPQPSPLSDRPEHPLQGGQGK